MLIIGMSVMMFEDVSVGVGSLANISLTASVIHCWCYDWKLAVEILCFAQCLCIAWAAWPKTLHSHSKYHQFSGKCRKGRLSIVICLPHCLFFIKRTFRNHEADQNNISVSCYIEFENRISRYILIFSVGT